MKMNIYDKDGKIISSFSKKDNAYDFIYHKNQFIFYNYHNYGKNILSICNMNGDLLKEIDVGTESHELLNSIAGCTKMLQKDSLIYYIHTDKLSLFELNLDDYSIKSASIDDDDFVVKEITEEQSGARTFSIPKYLFTNSSVNGLLAYKNCIVIKAELGHSIVEENEIKDNSNRYVAFYILDSNKKLKERIVFNISEYYKYISDVVSYKEELYAIKLQEAGTEKEKYALYKIDLID